MQIRLYFPLAFAIFYAIGNVVAPSSYYSPPLNGQYPPATPASASHSQPNQIGVQHPQTSVPGATRPYHQTTLPASATPHQKYSQDQPHETTAPLNFRPKVQSTPGQPTVGGPGGSGYQSTPPVTRPNGAGYPTTQPSTYGAPLSLPPYLSGYGPKPTPPYPLDSSKPQTYGQTGVVNANDRFGSQYPSGSGLHQPDLTQVPDK